MSDPDRPLEPTPEQVERYRADGFLVVEDLLDHQELRALRDRWAALFEHSWETGIAPDEVNYTPGVTPADMTRQLCNAWKADRVVAATTLSVRNASFSARLAGLDGVRIAQNNLIWKPPSGKALLAHQDAAYLEWMVPPNMTTCWVALDDTAADTGTIFYLRASHLWGRTPAGGVFHAPEDWLGHLRRSAPAGEATDLVPIEVPAGGASFHDGWTWHGSPPNERADAERRAIISHYIDARTRWHPEVAHPVYSRYRRPGEAEMDEAFFPVVWRSDGYRTPWLGDYTTNDTTGGRPGPSPR
ncbi:MAG: phytanoyl-CoA dioxygenase family protein [Actinomycetota bacterium]|nr:phytanoyl-CoA dioxygenase family protein [Actinomycetota bacterium]